MSEDFPDQEEKTPAAKKTRKVNPNGKKRGPKPKPVTKKRPVRELPLEGTPQMVETPDGKVLTFQETCEYVEVTVMEQTDEVREIPMNNGVNNPIWFIRGHKTIIPKPYLDMMDEINAIKLLKHEPINHGADFREYTVNLMKFPYMVHRTGLTYADYRAQFDKTKGLKDPWMKDPTA